MDQQNQQQPSSTQGTAVPPAKSGMAIAGFVLGIIALLTSFLPIINNLSFLLALLGLIFAIVGFVGIQKGKKSGKGLAIAALVICIVSGVVVLATQSAYSNALNQATSPSTATVSSSDSAAASDSSSGAASADADFTIADETLSKDTYNAKITGTLTNNTGKDKSYVSISYAVYDKDGNLIENAYANANDLKAGASWKFEAYVPTSDVKQVASFERTDVTSW